MIVLQSFLKDMLQFQLMEAETVIVGMLQFK